MLLQDTSCWVGIDSSIYSRVPIEEEPGHCMSVSGYDIPERYKIEDDTVFFRYSGDEPQRKLNKGELYVGKNSGRVYQVKVKTLPGVLPFRTDIREKNFRNYAIVTHIVLRSLLPKREYPDFRSVIGDYFSYEAESKLAVALEKMSEFGAVYVRHDREGINTPGEMSVFKSVVFMDDWWSTSNRETLYRLEGDLIRSFDSGEILFKFASHDRLSDTANYEDGDRFEDRYIDDPAFILFEPDPLPFSWKSLGK